MLNFIIIIGMRLEFSCNYLYEFTDQAEDIKIFSANLDALQEELEIEFIFQQYLVEDYFNNIE
jgi:hypothetical protein